MKQIPTLRIILSALVMTNLTPLMSSAWGTEIEEIQEHKPIYVGKFLIPEIFSMRNDRILEIPQKELDLTMGYLAKLENSLANFMENPLSHESVFHPIAKSFQDDFRMVFSSLIDILRDPQILMVKEDCIFTNFIRFQFMEKMIADLRNLIFYGDWAELQKYLEQNEHLEWGKLSKSKSFEKVLKGRGLYRGDQFDKLQQYEREFCLTGVYAFYLSNNLNNIGNKAIVTEDYYRLMGDHKHDGYEEYIRAYVKKHGGISLKKEQQIKVNWINSDQEFADNFTKKFRSIAAKMPLTWIDGPNTFTGIASSMKEAKREIDKHRLLGFVESLMPKMPEREEDKITESEKMMIYKDLIAESVHVQKIWTEVSYDPELIEKRLNELGAEEMKKRLKELRDRQEDARIQAIEFYKNLFSGNGQ